MQPGNSFDDAHETYEQFDSRWQGLRWRFTGPFLIVLGVSQAIFGWAGNSWWMRIGYSAACILFGVFLIAIIGWLCPAEAAPDLGERKAEPHSLDRE